MSDGPDEAAIFADTGEPATVDGYRKRLLGDAPDDEELAAAWLEWWTPDVASSTELVGALAELSNLQEHLAAHGFAIVRRLRPPS